MKWQYHYSKTTKEFSRTCGDKKEVKIMEINSVSQFRQAIIEWDKE